MNLGKFILLLSLLFALAVAQGDCEENCKCTSSVVVMTKEELTREIQSQTMSAVSSSARSGAVCNVNTTQVTDELYKRIVKLDAEKLVNLQEAINCPCETASTCKGILENNPSSESGYYWLQTSSTTAVKEYCDFSITARGSRGWMQIAKLDTTKPDAICPGQLVSERYNGKDVCAIQSDNSGCFEVIFPTNGVEYREVHGRILAYQKGRADGIHVGGIDGRYIDGVSLTHGLYRGAGRKHIWSFIAARDESSNRICHCSNVGYGRRPPDYVGLDYFCDTGVEQYTEPDDDIKIFTNRPLWDGVACGTRCCRFNNPPWFYKYLPYTTTDDIEMRICRRYGATREDFFIEKIDLYVR